MITSILRSFFVPAAFVMNRLRYSGKFLFITALFIFPLFIATYFFISDTNRNITFAEKERVGVQYLFPVSRFLKSVQQHRGMTSAYLNGDASFAELIADKRKEILAFERDIDAVDARYGGTLATHDRWTNLKQEWGRVTSESLGGNPEESFKMHTTLVERIALFMSYIGDTSNLILDPDIDSYYTVDVLVNTIPFMSERLGQIRAFGLTLPPGKRIEKGDKKIFLSLSSLIDYSLQKIYRGFETVYGYNPALRETTLAAAMAEVRKDVNSFLASVDERIINADVNTIQSRAYYEQATETIDEIYRLYDVTSPILDGLLQKRIDGFLSKRDMIRNIIIAVFLLVIYFFIGFYISVRNVIDALRQATDRMMKGRVDSEVVLEARDELSEVVTSFNTLAKALTVSNTRLEADIQKRIAIEKEIQDKNEDINKFNQLMIGRELKMIELKKEIEGLKKAGGR